MESRESGVAIVVWRRVADGIETLLLHRSIFPPDFRGNWAWSTPGGGRKESESPDAAAARELREETGLTVECRRVTATTAASEATIEVFVFEAEVPADAKIILSSEHDRCEWVTASELTRCLPP